MDSKKCKTRNRCIKAFVLSVCVIGCVLLIWGVLKPSSTESNYSSNPSEYSSGADVEFTREGDVWQYLISHRFTSQDGRTISFSYRSSVLYSNGKAIPQSAEMQTFSSTSATIRTRNPYGKTTLYLSNGFLKDSDGTCYYAK